MLNEQIVSWLERKREQCLKAAQLLNIPPSIQISRPVVDEMTETGYHSHNEMIEVTPLAIPNLYYTLQEHLQREETQHDLASALYATYGGRCKVWQPIEQEDFDDNPSVWIQKRLLPGLAADYFMGLSTLENGNRSLAEKLAEDLIHLIKATPSIMLRHYPSLGFDRWKTYWKFKMCDCEN